MTGFPHSRIKINVFSILHEIEGIITNIVQECVLKYFLLILLTLTTLMATGSSDKLIVDNNRSDEPVIYYKDYNWDVGVIGGMTFDGQHAEHYYVGLGYGLHLGYHLTEFVSLHAEAIDFFDTLTKDDAHKDDKSRMYALSGAFDFSAERPYSLYAKGGLGYEDHVWNTQHSYNAVSLLGFGFRYMLTNSISATVEGRWKYVLDPNNSSDTSLLGTIALDYHFGLSDNYKKRLTQDKSK